MPENAHLSGATEVNVPLGITALTGRAALRLKSWVPGAMSGGRTVVLDGRELPAQVGGTMSGQIRVLCLGPGEWLIVSDVAGASTVREQIEQELQQQGVALVDLTHGLAVLQVERPDMRELLSKGCGLDLHPRAFPPDRCASTRFAQIPVIVDCLDGPPRFDLYVARSYLGFLQSWLADATIEFDVPGSG
ncbi:MAG: soxG [Gammaproteobacteria bacterium]|nr:soxG [Gammaproteobacteria bacterium]